MSTISLQGLSKRFGDTVAVNGLELAIEAGELVGFLGPSGCGKTTTLRIIAGFETPTEGRVILGTNDVTRLPPEQRNFGMVFQNYALFPHLTVRQNVGFGLEMRRVKGAEIRNRVNAILEKVGLAGKGDRYPRQLSGGEQQRTALARALVIEPTVLLLDEPLANLDAKLREEMRFYIRSLQQDFHITTIYVTHDQAEALVLADRIAVLMSGSLQQVGTPEDLYKRPCNTRVASFIGLTNLIPGHVKERGREDVVLETDFGTLVSYGPKNVRPGTRSVLSIRPESLHLVSLEDLERETYLNAVCGTIKERAFLGNMVDYRLDIGQHVQLRVQGTHTDTHRPGDRVAVTFGPDEAWTVPLEGE